MDRVIVYLNRCADRREKLSVVATAIRFDVDYIRKICRQDEKCKTVFRIVEDFIIYDPPMGIIDKEHLQRVVSEAFPKGVPISTLALCYPYAIHDLCDIEFNNLAYRHVSNKSTRGGRGDIIFSPYDPVVTHLGKLWDAHAGTGEGVSLFPPFKRSNCNTAW